MQLYDCAVRKERTQYLVIGLMRGYKHGEDGGVKTEGFWPNSETSVSSECYDE
jgi:hypothetical protein